MAIQVAAPEQGEPWGGASGNRAGDQSRRERDAVLDELLAAVDRMELTEKGWVEKVTHGPHGNMGARLLLRLFALGVTEDALYDNVRLSRDEEGLRYVPDFLVVLPTNLVPMPPDADYPGVPDLVVEILSPGEANEARDRDEKVRNYARRGIPHYWIADPGKPGVATGLVTWLRLHEGVYVAQWTRPLAEVALPW
jgi:Uma2 family endonuclease